jgi:hypothetical protein
MPKKREKTDTLESGAYLDGLFQDFSQQVARYHELTAHLMGLEARLELAEKTLILTRDHLKMALKTSEGDTTRHFRDWKSLATKVRFVGMRLVDACTAVLKEHVKMTPTKLLETINEGTFRFRTNAPLREIHAALLRHPHVNREGDFYIWTAPKEEQMRMPLKLSKQASTTSPEDKPKIAAALEAKPN